MVVLGLFWRDAIDHMIELQFNLVERGNVGVTFPHPLDRAASLVILSANRVYLSSKASGSFRCVCALDTGRI